MMKKIILSSLLLFLLGNAAIAQQETKSETPIPQGLAVCTFGHGLKVCGTDEYVKELDEKYPEYVTNRAALEEKTQHWVAKHQNDFENFRNEFIIPVVVHVVYNTAAENISDNQINSQITRLNTDFNALNTETIPSVFSGLKANCGIQFAITTQDPNGNPTTGVTRTSTTITEFTTFDAVKSLVPAWDTKHYLNIWVCDLNITSGGSGTIAAYAAYPGGPDALDGAVCDYQHFGTGGQALSGTLGRSMVHEIGHYLNLIHIWGEGDYQTGNCTDSDNVADTPNQDVANFGCPSFPHLTCGNGTFPDGPGDMFMNYMDYSNDACIRMFTKGQQMRMYAALLESRTQLIRPEVFVPGGNCPQSHNITSAIIGGVAKYEADDFITASNTINPISAVVYDAKNYIVLQDGFWAKEGSLFRAVTGDGCGGDVRLATSPVLTNNTTFVATAINGFSVYPNPTTGNINVSYMLEEAEDTHLNIYNVLGEIVSTQVVTNDTAGTHSYTVNLNNMPQGIYLFSLTTKQGIKTVRVVKN